MPESLMMDISESQEIYTVSQLNREVRLLLDGSLPILWIEGEISNFAAPRSGHWYFSLKDATAQVRCAMFRPRERCPDFTPKDGAQVLVRARVSVYEPRGDYQLIVERMEELGEGRLRKAFEVLKNRLLAEGLFDEKFKKPLPAYPETIGVITSTTGAAIRDILSVLGRRFPAAQVIVYPAQVQGDAAAVTIVKALATANRRAECDVLLLARGGGSLEDLWPFNEESVARAIFASEIPIVSGVGHETDFTIADFVADLRAPTPSVAAEHVTPDIEEILAGLAQCRQQLQRQIQYKISQFQQQLGWHQRHLTQLHPLRRLAEKIQLLDFYEITLTREISRRLEQAGEKLSSFAARLSALNPLTVLSRGFSVSKRLSDNKIIHSSREVNPGERIGIELQKGSLICTVDECHVA